MSFDDPQTVQAEPQTAAQQMEYPIPNQYAATGILGGCYPADASPEEKLLYQAQNWLSILRNAHTIRQDPRAMAAVRDLIRKERDELAEILDEA